MERDFLVADISLGVGLGALAAATVLYFTTGGTERSGPALSIRPERGGALFSLSTEF